MAFAKMRASLLGSRWITSVTLLFIAVFLFRPKLDIEISQVSKERAVLSFRNIFFVHVGKAGGNTFRVIFKGYCNSDRKRIAEACEDIPESELANRVTGYAHDEDYQGSVKSADAFLYNLRHPVDRMISWYNYEHPKSCMHNRQTRRACRTKKHIKKRPNGSAAMFYNDCFPTQQRLPLLGLHSTSTGSDTGLSQECFELGRKVIRGEKYGKGFKHMYYNMLHYANETIYEYPDKGVLVIRTESLWEDLKDLDTMLGGRGTFGGIEGTKDSHGSEKYKQKTGGTGTLSVEDYGLLCCAIMPEMNVYRNLIESAANLDDSATKAAISQTANKCGFANWDEMMNKCSNQSP